MSEQNQFVKLVLEAEDVCLNKTQVRFKQDYFNEDHIGTFRKNDVYVIAKITKKYIHLFDGCDMHKFPKLRRLHEYLEFRPVPFPAQYCRITNSSMERVYPFMTKGAKLKYIGETWPGHHQLMYIDRKTHLSYCADMIHNEHFEPLLYNDPES